MQLPNNKNVRFLTTGTVTLLSSVDKYTTVKALRPEKSLHPLNIRVVNHSNVHQPESLYFFLMWFFQVNPMDSMKLNQMAKTINAF